MEMGFRSTVSKRFRLVARDFVLPALLTGAGAIVSWVAGTWIPGLNLPGPIESAAALAVTTLGYKVLRQTDYGNGSSNSTE